MAAAGSVAALGFIGRVLVGAQAMLQRIRLRFDDPLAIMCRYKFGDLMLEFLFQSNTAPFSIAILVMILLGAVEALGLGGSTVDIDIDDVGPVSGGLDWLNVGRLPLLIVLVVFLAAFGLSGLILQMGAIMVSGTTLPWFLAMLLAMPLALPATRLLSKGLGRILPRDETSAVHIDTLLGRRARIVIGVSRRGSPARARVEDSFGKTHFVMVEPLDDSSFDEQTLLLLTARHGQIFHAIEIEPDIFSQVRLSP